MSSRIPPLQALLAFETAARHESYSRAADELHLTHGAISHAIRGLEERLGTPLFRREGHRMVLTAEGQTLAAKVRHGLRLLENAFDRSPAHSGAHVRVSTLPAFASRWLVPRLHRFTAAHPEIALDLQATTELARFNRQDGIDVAIRYGPGGWPNLRQYKLMDERIFPVCSPGYRAGNLPQRPEDLKDCTLLRYPREPWLNWFAAANLEWPEPADGPTYRDATVLLDAAVAGQGIALARAALVAEDIRAGWLRRLFTIDAPGGYAYWFVCRATSPNEASIQAFRDWIVSEADQFSKRRDTSVSVGAPALPSKASD